MPWHRRGEAGLARGSVIVVDTTVVPATHDVACCCSYLLLKHLLRAMDGIGTDVAHSYAIIVAAVPATSRAA